MLSVEDRLLWIIHHERFFNIHGMSIMGFDSFTLLLEEFYEAAWCVDKDTAIMLAIEYWYKKWLKIRRDQPPIHLLYILEEKVKEAEDRNGSQ